MDREAPPTMQQSMPQTSEEYAQSLFVQNERLLAAFERLATPAQSPVPVHARSSSPRSEKTPDVPEFTPTTSQPANNKEIDLFESRLRVKFTINHDRYVHAAARVNYVFSRLRSSAADTVLPGFSDDSFADWEEIIQLLRQVFGDPDPQWYYSQRLLSLRQNNRLFHDFYAEFRLLVEKVPALPQEFQKHLLRNAISRELTAKLSNVDIRGMSYSQFTIECQRQSSLMVSSPAFSRRTMVPASAPGYISSAPGSRPVPAPITSGTRPGYTPSTLEARAVPAPTTAKLTVVNSSPSAPDLMDIDQRQYRRNNGLCFYCGSGDHRRAECPVAPRRPVQHRSADVMTPSRCLSPTLAPSSPVQGKVVPLT